MKTNWLQIQPAKWLIMGVLVLLAALTLAFQGGDGDGPNPAHCHTCATRTPTSTATSTQTPISSLQACQVQQIYFDDEPYTPGTTVTGTVDTPLKVTLRVADAQGAPLIGANVDATVTQTNSVQAAAIPPLEDQSGTYDGVYTPQNVGTYLLSFSVSDFTGPRFLPCSAEAIVEVGEEATPTLTSTPTSSPTPTGTVTITPTPTDTPTITPTPTSASVRVIPSVISTTLCSLSETSTVIAVDASNVKAVEMEVGYSPSIIQVIDPDRPRPPVQVRPLLPADWTITENRVDTTNGRIFFKASGGNVINGTNGLIGIDWRPQRVGNSPVTLTKAILTDAAGQPISATLQSGAVQVNFVTNCRTGTTTLQGRSDHSGVIVAGDTGQQVETDVDGYFAIIAEDRLSLTFPGYLAGQADLLSLDAAQGEGQANNLGSLNILAGDVNGDSVINILDMTYLAGRYLSTDATGDLNGDGIVNILDLTLVAGNYQRRGPLTTWQ